METIIFHGQLLGHPKVIARIITAQQEYEDLPLL